MSGDRTAAYALLPAESMALTVGLAQVQRGEEPSPNVAAMCVLALARLVERCDYSASATPFLPGGAA